MTELVPLDKKRLTTAMTPISPIQPKIHMKRLEPRDRVSAAYGRRHNGTAQTERYPCAIVVSGSCATHRHGVVRRPGA